MDTWLNNTIMMNKEILSEFNETTNELIGILSSLNLDQLNTVPFEGSWTAGQVGHHLLKSYGIAAILQGNTIETKRPVNEKINHIRSMFDDHTIKMESPEFILPTDKRIEKEKLLESLAEKINQVRLFAEQNHDLSLTCLDFDLPGAGSLTRSEWIQFMSIHTQRHIRQLKKIVEYLLNV